MTEKIIKAAKRLGWKVEHITWEDKDIITTPAGKKYYPNGSVLHKLLVLAVLERERWGICPVDYMDYWELYKKGDTTYLWCGNFASLPLAAITAWLEKEKEK